MDCCVDAPLHVLWAGTAHNAAAAPRLGGKKSVRQSYVAVDARDPAFAWLDHLPLLTAAAQHALHDHHLHVQRRYERGHLQPREHGDATVCAFLRC